MAFNIYHNVRKFKIGAFVKLNNYFRDIAKHKYRCNDIINNFL